MLKTIEFCHEICSEDEKMTKFLSESECFLCFRQITHTNEENNMHVGLYRQKQSEFKKHSFVALKRIPTI